MANASLEQAQMSKKVKTTALSSSAVNPRVLKSINLAIYEKRVTAFIGPSGGSKPTLLRVLHRMYDLYPNQRRPARSF